MGLQRRFRTHGDDEHIVNVWNIANKEILFTGNMSNAATFLNVPKEYISRAVRFKVKLKRKYAVRTAKKIL